MRVPTADDQLARPIGRPLDGLDRKLANPESEYTPAVIPMCPLCCATQREHHRVCRWPVGSRSLAAALEAIHRRAQAAV